MAVSAANFDQVLAGYAPGERDQVELLLVEMTSDEEHALLVEAVNDLITLHNDRVVAGVRTRVPTIIWGSLYLLLLLSMLGMGYYNGMKERRSPVANTALAFSFTVVILLIADLDRPRDGLIKSDQFLMQDMGRRLQQLDWGESDERQKI